MLSTLDLLFRRVAQAGCSLLSALDTVLYPQHCLITGEPLLGESPLRHVSTRGLDTCAPAPENHELMLTAQKRIGGDDIAFSSATSLWALEPESSIHDVIVAIKYRGLHTLAVDLGKHLGEFLKERGPAWLQANTIHTNTYISYVPVHKTRKRERGYDQAQCIAQGVALALNRSVTQTLVRRRYTGTQTALSDAERARNMTDAFQSACTASLRGSTVLLVDDVFTTGATLNSAATALLCAGVRRVDVATLCATI